MTRPPNPDDLDRFDCPGAFATEGAQLTRRGVFGLLGAATFAALGGCAPVVPRAAAPGAPNPSPAPKPPPARAAGLAAPELEVEVEPLAPADVAPDDPSLPALPLPPRAKEAETATAFLERTSSLKRWRFEAAVLEQLKAGNVPSFMRRFARVRVSMTTVRGRVEGELYVAREYLCIGSDQDFFRVPLTAGNAQSACNLTGCTLPTRKLVDEIWKQADARIGPRYIEGGPTLANRLDYPRHHVDVEEARRAAGVKLGVLIAGTMKDIVLSNKLMKKAKRVAIYGWHRLNGEAIQPLSTAHGANYADYSHGVRLVKKTMLVDGKERSVAKVLESPGLSALLSDEGPLEITAYPLT